MPKMMPVQYLLQQLQHFFCVCNLGETLPLSSGNKITLKFTANGTETAKGFHFVYQGKSLPPSFTQPRLRTARSRK